MAELAARRWDVPWWQAAAMLAGVAGASALGGPVAAAVTAAVAAAGLALSAARRAERRAASSQVASPAPGRVIESDGVVFGEEAPEAVVVYRPLRSLPKLHLRGVEAELRWHHPTLGTLPPSTWPAAMPAGTASALLDAWTGHALPQFARWLPELRERGGATLWLRVPTAWSALDSFAARLTDALARHGLDPSVLVLRVPLQVAGRRAQLPESVLALQALGVTLAVDAFGAGSASLTHLDRLPVRTVCLASSFVERAGPTTPQRWVVESTARLAASMGMSTLAEGVSQESQVLALAALGCDLGVGDVCGPWMDASEWSARWSGATAAHAA